ncbi:MAG: hypothetical protein WD379_06165 [Dehalococcoidia bacterium]
MRLRRLLAPLLIAALLASAAIACDGDGDGDGGNGGDGGDGAGATGPLTPGEQPLDVSGSITLQLIEAAASSAPALGQQAQTVELAGTATINAGPDGAAFDVPAFSLSGAVTANGADAPIELVASANAATTGAITGPSGTAGLLAWTMDFNFDTTLSGGAVRNAAPIPLAGSLSEASGRVAQGLLATSDEFADVNLVDEQGAAAASISAVSLSFVDPTRGVPPAAVAVDLPGGFEYLGAFGASPAGFEADRHEDGAGGQFYDDSSATAGFIQGENDILSVDVARMDVTEDAAEILDLLYGCGRGFDAWLTECNNPDEPFPSGEVFLVSMELGAPPPQPGNPVLDDHACSYTIAFDDEGGDNLDDPQEYPEDLLRDTGLWSVAEVGLGEGYSNQFRRFDPGSAEGETVKTANTRTVVAPGVNRVTSIIPVNVVAGATGLRAVAECHVEDRDASGSGGDVLGDDPSLAELPGADATMEISDIEALWSGEAGEPGSVSADQAPPGDANCDGFSNVADAAWVIAELLEEGPETACPLAADANGDDLYDFGDAVKIITQRFLAPRL